MTKLHSTLGEFIAHRRQELGYRKMKFSELIGVGRDSLKSWETNRFVPAGKNMYALAEVLKMNDEEIKVYFGNHYHGSSF